MPVHEYQCETCGHIFEEITFSLGAVKTSTYCPVCEDEGKEGIAKKIMSGGNIFTVHGYNSNNGYAGNMR